MLTVAISGSFHRHMTAITDAVYHLQGIGARVVSPSDPRIVAQIGDFLFVASDRYRTVRLVQDRHLESIQVADFLWLVCPDGYVGPSASLELGFAIANRVPIYSTGIPGDTTLKEYVRTVKSIEQAVERSAQYRRENPKPDTFLIDPLAHIDEAHTILQQLRHSLDLGSATPRSHEIITTHQERIVQIVGKSVLSKDDV